MNNDIYKGIVNKYIEIVKRNLKLGEVKGWDIETIIIHSVKDLLLPFRITHISLFLFIGVR